MNWMSGKSSSGWRIRCLATQNIKKAFGSFWEGFLINWQKEISFECFDNMGMWNKTGKFQGFCYEDQRSTILAIDNLKGTKVKGRTIWVDHAANYRVPKVSEVLNEVTREFQETGRPRGLVFDVENSALQGLFNLADKTTISCWTWFRHLEVNVIAFWIFFFPFICFEDRGIWL